MSSLLSSISSLASPWAYVVIGLLATAESAAFVGLAIPGEAALLLGGFLAYQGRVSVVVMAGAAAAGAIVGDSIGYEIGRTVGTPLRRSRLGRRVGDHRWDKAEAYLRERGGRAVFLGRWIGLLRALVPMLAGMGRLPYRTFLPWNVAGGLTWAPAFVFLGYAAGGSYHRVEKLAGRASLLLLLVVVVVGGVVVAGRWVARHRDRVRAGVARVANQRWVRAGRTRYAAQLEFLTARLRPGGAFGLSLSVGLLLLAAAGAVFGGVAEDVVGREGVVALDLPVLHFLADHRSAGLTSLLRAVADAGSAPAMAILVLAVGGLLAWRWGTVAPLGLLAAGWLGVAALAPLIKLIVHRPPPPAALAVIGDGGYAFPSTHDAITVAVLGMLAWLLVQRSMSWTRGVTVCVLGLLAVGFASLSRVYLGLHWASDVAGSWALGAAWLLIVATA